MTELERQRLADDAQRHLREAIGLLDTLRWHQASANADLALSLAVARAEREVQAAAPPDADNPD